MCRVSEFDMFHVPTYYKSYEEYWRFWGELDARVIAQVYFPITVGLILRNFSSLFLNSHSAIGNISKGVIKIMLAFKNNVVRRLSKTF